MAQLCVCMYFLEKMCFSPVIAIVPLIEIAVWLESPMVQLFCSRVFLQVICFVVTVIILRNREPRLCHMTFEDFIDWNSNLSLWCLGTDAGSPVG